MSRPVTAREETRVITANVPIRKLSPDQRARALKTILDRHPHYAGLQEWGEDLLLAGAERRGFGRARAKGGPPILFDLGRTGLLHVHARRLAFPELVGHLPGRKDRLGASIATESIFEDDELGEGVVIDAHLTAEVQYDGEYRRDLAHRLRVWRHKRECRRLDRLVERHRSKGRWVRVTVDGNFDGLQLPPLTSCWDGRKDAGTLGGRTVDIVFADRPARRVETFATGSDHRAVVATY